MTSNSSWSIMRSITVDQVIDQVIDQVEDKDELDRI